MGRKRIKRTGKAAARRIDTTAVEEFVTERSKQQQLTRTTDNDLFFIDTAAQPKLSKRERYRTKELSYITATKGNPLIKAIKKDPLNKSKQPAKAERMVVADLADKIASGIVQVKPKGGVKTMSQFGVVGESQKIDVFDVWTGGAEGDGGAADKAKDGSDDKKSAIEKEDEEVREEWLAPARMAIKPPVKVPKTRTERVSALPALRIDPGESYRPSYKDHQDLLAQVVAKEMRKKELNKKWERVLKKEPANQAKLPNVPVVDPLAAFGNAPPKKRKQDGANGARPAKRARTGDSEREEDEDEGESGGEEEEEEEEEEEPKVHNPWSTKIDKTTRNKQKRHLRQLRKKTAKEKLKAQRRKIAMIGKLINQIEAEQKQKESALRRKKKRQQIMERIGTKRLGPHKFEEAPRHVLPSAELPGSLRRVMPANMLLFERMQSLQKRNMIEPRKHHEQRPVYGKKLYERRSMRMDDINDV
eukprot:TRINITY_DN742_c0_g2_i2.p1 TRINITY_DN742_c0_g2~~TRINITY_DN742_c0_g2_i2.p1  ORF type:complete len:474 (+),score=153.06 TRINITY_DN742_c0_g2_i2:1357-2778(+)